jgi:hypothetical protein
MAKPRRTQDTIRVKGLDEFRKELRKLQDAAGADGLSLLKDANFRVANMVIGKAQSRASGLGAMQAKAASTMKAGRAQARATITGGARIPFFFGAEFGAYSNVPRQRGGRAFVGFNQFEPFKKPGNGNAGYFLYPTIKAESKRIIDMYADELEKISKQAFPD